MEYIFPIPEVKDIYITNVTGRREKGGHAPPGTF